MDTGVWLLQLQSYRDYLAKQDWEKLSVLATGAGVSIADMFKLPGSSAAMYYMSIPYATDVSYDFCGIPEAKESTNPPSLVDENMAKILHLKHVSSMEKYDGLTFVTVTGALETNRVRRGPDHAYILVSRIAEKMESYHIELKKPTPQQWEDLNKSPSGVMCYRIQQDICVSDVALQIAIYGYDHNVSNADYQSKSIMWWARCGQKITRLM